jgi:hypothetical protein
MIGGNGSQEITKLAEVRFVEGEVHDATFDIYDPRSIQEFFVVVSQDVVTYRSDECINEGRMSWEYDRTTLDWHQSFAGGVSLPKVMLWLYRGQQGRSGSHRIYHAEGGGMAAILDGDPQRERGPLEDIRTFQFNDRIWRHPGSIALFYRNYLPVRLSSSALGLPDSFPRRVSLASQGDVASDSGDKRDCRQHQRPTFNLDLPVPVRLAVGAVLFFGGMKMMGSLDRLPLIAAGWCLCAAGAAIVLFSGVSPI